MHLLPSALMLCSFWPVIHPIASLYWSINHTSVCCCESVMMVTPRRSSSMLSKSLLCSESSSPQGADMSEAEDAPTDSRIFSDTESSVSPFPGVTPLTAVAKSPRGSWCGGRYWLGWKCGLACWCPALPELRVLSLETGRLDGIGV